MTSPPQNYVDKIRDMILQDRKIKFHKVVEALRISQGVVFFSILNDKLDVKKISARWLPCLLTAEYKRNRVVDSEAVFA